METLIEISGFEPGYVTAPWYEWSDSRTAVSWALQATKVTSLQLQDRGSVSWTEFANQFDTTFGRPEWRANAVLQRVLYAAATLEQNNPLALTEEHLLAAGASAQTALDSWSTDQSDLLGLAEYLGVDPVQVGWVAGEQPEFSRDFASYVGYYVKESGSLPDAATIGSWFGGSLLPEAIVARYQTDFPNGVPTKDGTVLTIDQIGPHYLGAAAWSATEMLNDDEIDPELVQEILAIFSSDEPLDDAQAAKIKQAVDAGIITFEDA